MDLIVAFEHCAYFFEIKGRHVPLRVGLNGTWGKRSYADGWTTVRNYYSQTLDAGYAVKDSLTKFLNKTVNYLESVLLFVPDLHPNSDIPQSDFKVKINMLKFLQSIAVNENGNCSLDNWRQFCVHHKLEKLISPDSSIDQLLLETERSCNQYTNAFIKNYEGEVKNFIPLDCNFQNYRISTEELISIIPSYARCQNVQGK